MSQEPTHLKLKQSGATNVDSVRIEGKMNYEQGTESSQIMFVLSCKYLPTGTVVSFRSDKPGPTPPIELKPTTVIAYPNFVVGIICDVPAEYSCVITYVAECRENPAPDAQVTLQAYFPIPE